MNQHEKDAVEKMKLAAMLGVRGEDIVSPAETADSNPARPTGGDDSDVALPPHQRILSLGPGSVVEEHPRKAARIPAALLSRIIFLVSTGEGHDPADLTKGEVRAVLEQLAALGQELDRKRMALAKAAVVLELLKKGGGVTREEVLSALAAIAHATA